MVQADTVAPEKLMCSVHPNIETTLRCNKCGRPMCVKCSVRTPVGYRCKECVRGQQQVFYSAKNTDLLLQGAVSLILSVIAGVIVGLISSMMFFYLTIILALFASTAVGAGIADIAHRVAGRRRGQYSWLVVAGAVAFGGIFALLLGLLLGGAGLLGGLVYIGVATS